MLLSNLRIKINNLQRVHPTFKSSTIFGPSLQGKSTLKQATSSLVLHIKNLGETPKKKMASGIMQNVAT